MAERLSNETDFGRHQTSGYFAIVSDRVPRHGAVPVHRRVFGRAFRIPHGRGPRDVRLSPRTAAESIGQRRHPVRGADPCGDPVHDRVHRRRQVRLLEAVPYADKRVPLYPRQGDRRGGLRRACAGARYRDGARRVFPRVRADRGLRRIRGQVADPGYPAAACAVLPLRRAVGKRGAARLVADPERVPCVRRSVHLLLCFDHPAGALFPHDLHAEPQELSHHGGRVAAAGQERGADAFDARGHSAACLLHDRADGTARRQAAKAALLCTEPFAKTPCKAH